MQVPGGAPPTAYALDGAHLLERPLRLAAGPPEGQRIVTENETGIGPQFILCLSLSNALSARQSSLVSYSQ